MSNEKETAGKTAMKVFTFNESNQPIRVDVINGEPWFVAKDVAKALNITWSGHTLDQIPEEWKGMVKFTTPGGAQDLTAISEAGMYKLAFRCQSSEVADKFTNFVASEILPSIRKTGRYEVGMSARISNGSVDARDVPYERMRYMGDDVRVIVLNGIRWISINDLYRCLGIRTDSCQSARMLNARQTLAQKIHLFGNTHPAWFTTMEGARLLVSGSRKARSVKKLMLDFTPNFCSYLGATFATNASNKGRCSGLTVK